MKKRLLNSCLLVLAFSFFVPASASAAGSISVSPALLDVELVAPSEEKTIPVTISNSYPSAATFTPSLQSINQDTGTFTPTGKQDTALAPFITFDTAPLTIPANSSATLPVTFKNNASLAPGGHYSTLVLTSQSNAAGSVNLQSAISISIFLVKRGGERQSIKLESLSFSRIIFSLPETVLLTFKNDGNVHVIPRASVSVVRTGTADPLVSHGIANATSIPVLPGKSLQRSVAMKNLISSWLPGRYTLRIQTRADGIDGFEETARSFYYIPPVFVALILLGIALLVAAAVSLRRLLKRRRNRRRISTESVRTEAAAPDDPDKVHVRVHRRIRIKSHDASGTSVQVKKKPRSKKISIS